MGGGGAILTEKRERSAVRQIDAPAAIARWASSLFLTIAAVSSTRRGLSSSMGTHLLAQLSDGNQVQVTTRRMQQTQSQWGDIRRKSARRGRWSLVLGTARPRVPMPDAVRLPFPWIGGIWLLTRRSSCSVGWRQKGYFLPLVQHVAVRVSSRPALKLSGWPTDQSRTTSCGAARRASWA